VRAPAASNGSARSTGAAGRSGTTTLLSVPRPGLEVTLIWPAMASTRLRVIDSPRPVPPKPRAVSTAACSKGANTRSTSRSVIARSRVDHGQADVVVRAALQADRHGAGVGELDRVGDQVGEHLLQA
jgi:hypothetical protein